MVTCPGCKTQLPDWAVKCQFCGADASKVARPVVQKKVLKSTAPSWVWTAYYVVSVLMILEGAGGILRVIRDAGMMVGGQPIGLGVVGFVSIALEGITILFGIGLLAHVQQIRDIMTYLCGLRIIFGALNLLTSIAATMMLGFLGLLLTLFTVFNIATAAFMIYLIGETDKVAPNI